MIRVTFACGHSGETKETVDAPPICGCGETRIRQTTARAPHFRGACSGPYAETRGVEPGIVNVAPGGPLVLKQER